MRRHAEKDFLPGEKWEYRYENGTKIGETDMNKLEILKKLKEAVEFVKDRIAERTSWDGGVIVAGALSIILFGGIVKAAAWVALAYGIWTLVKSE